MRHYSTAKKISIGIRREQKNRWERRVPLIPEHVERLVNEYGAKVYIQPSTKRVIPDSKYQQHGAFVHEDLSMCDVILGVKEVPLRELIPHKNYLFFSHTHKGQPYNMTMLKEILDKGIRLMDYELLTNENGRRLVQFSRFAGYAEGMIDGLHVLGQRLLALGYGTPFLSIGMSHLYRNLSDARLDVTRSGQVIADEGLPKRLGPMSFIVTGDGNVSRGALHVFKCLPFERVTPDELAALSTSTSFDNHKVYLCQVKPQDYIVGKDGSSFKMDRYLSHPEEYKSVFAEKIAPYARFILNGIFWDERYPRLMTLDETREMALENRMRLLTLADVSCDIHGSFEFMSKASTIDKPWYMYDPIEQKEHHDLESRGIQIMSIDNLPTEMPLEASEYFSEALLPFVTEMAKGNFSHPVLERATICKQGQLVPRFKKLEPVIEKHSKPVQPPRVHTQKKILLLGSGFVAKPLVDYLLRHDHNIVTIATNNQEEGVHLSEHRLRAPVVPLDVSNDTELLSLIENHDIVVSFVPATLHPVVAQKCIQAKKHLVTASYISPKMKEFDAQCKHLGLTFLNEIGLDPGIDHLTAMQVFDETKHHGGRILGFTSWCGGLPAPEASNNPFGYKFSWSPKGVLLAGLNSALYRQDSKEIRIDGKDLLKSAVPVDIFKGYSFEGLPNRDSLQYISQYQLDKDIPTMFRGTLRYKGYSQLMHQFAQCGFLSQDPTKHKTWQSFVQQLKPSPELQQAIHFLGMHNEPMDGNTVLDAFCALLQKKLVYSKSERDMVAMHHEFIIDHGHKKEKLSSTLIQYGTPGGYSAMAKTVGLPAAICTQMLLDGDIKRTGVLAPMTRDIYEPTIKKLAKEGIQFIETKTLL
ncbi:Saccharopine dehydrogenase-domain-containing protein [Gorgonomyces haynaldii]|nr:Saccharopine dehydrogenase-domain-containing protein [Gorgonomyces haynaldii]